VTFDAGDGPRAGAFVPGGVVDLAKSAAAAGADPSGLDDVHSILERGADGLRRASHAAAYATHSREAVADPAAVRLLAPVPRPRQILGVGRNYADHAAEVGGPAQEKPRIFVKNSASVVGPGTAVLRPPDVSKLDFEVELAAVIGRRLSRATRTEAAAAIIGYTILDDISAREFQFDVTPPQTSFAKGMASFCPMGPCLVTQDEFPDPLELRVRCWVNGRLMQDANTRDMIWPPPTLVAYISRYVDLAPGDIIATGTPAGVGAFRKPPSYLEPGDRIRMEIDCIGILEHSIA
jgi:2-keto-4-pentenoate hydratase/2-oxohepta-3-ene-1,7-dioic acid hydratase in catechol pathway